MEPSAHLFAPLTIRGVRFRNRIAVAPMSQYSSEDGFAGDWHLVHLGSRAVGGAAAVIGEAAAVEPRGRISPNDLGIWKDEHIGGLARIARFVKQQGAVPGIHLAHAGRKASTEPPWKGGSAIPPEAGGWQTVAPSAIPFRPSDPVPAELNTAEIPGIVEGFRKGAENAKLAGFDGVEIHGANGYLIDQFLQDGSNHRTDEYGGSIENRARLMLEVADAAISVWGAKRVGMHLAPRGDSQDMHDSNPPATFGYVARELGRRGLGFLLAREYFGPDRLGPQLKKQFGGVYIANEK